MCYKFKEPDSITEAEKIFNARFHQPEVFNPSKYKFGYELPDIAVILDENPSSIIMARWGLMPSTAASMDPKMFLKKVNTLNARIETVGTLKTYKNYTDNRCLILAQSFIEYKHIPKPGLKTPNKIPYEIFTPNRKPFAIAGLYAMVGDTPTVTLLTTAANTLMAEIHNSAKRMPVILKKEEQELWLERERLEPYHSRMEVELVALPIAKGSF